MTKRHYPICGEEPLRIFIGYDSREPMAYHVLSHSILTRSTMPVAISPLRQDTLRAAGIYTRERGPTESTEFSLTRFLVPYLSGYQGFSVFMDSDMLCRVDIAELWPLIREHLFWGTGNTIPDRSKRQAPFAKASVLCCQHDYTPSEATKFLGNIQTVYPKKNWSSFMVFANSRCGRLTPEYVNMATGLDLHRFNWCDEVASLPLEWNHLVSEYQPNPEAKIVHWTLGGPWFPEYRDAEFADEWNAEVRSLLNLELAAV